MGITPYLKGKGDMLIWLPIYLQCRCSFPGNIWEETAGNPPPFSQRTVEHLAVKPEIIKSLAKNVYLMNWPASLERAHPIQTAICAALPHLPNLKVSF